MTKELEMAYPHELYFVSTAWELPVFELHFRFSPSFSNTKKYAARDAFGFPTLHVHVMIRYGTCLRYDTLRYMLTLYYVTAMVFTFIAGYRP